MAKLNQIIAVRKGKKDQAESTKTQVYHDLQKPTLFEGIRKVFTPKREDDLVFPEERKIVQMKVSDCIARFSAAIGELMDCTATQDWSNATAKATVYIGERPILVDVPVTYLLFLEHQLVDLHTFVSKIPTVDPAYEWDYDDTSDSLATKPVQTFKTRKEAKFEIVAPPTDHHKAQVERTDVDVVIGTWTTITFSGAIKASEKNAMLERVKRLAEAIKEAREAANLAEVTYQTPSKPLLKYIFDGV